MEIGRLLGVGLTLEHRHSEGEWVRLEERARAHDPAARDPERGWEAGTIYACPRCEEYVRIVPADRPPHG